MKWITKIVSKLTLSPFYIIRNIVYELIYSKKRIKTMEDWLMTMYDKGVYVFSDLVSQADLELLRKEYDSVRRLRKDEIETSGQLNSRIFEHGVISKNLESIVSKFMDFASRYFQTNNIYCELTYFQESVYESNLEDIPGGQYHVDDNKRNVKFIVYLNDVTEFNGPFSYAERTHSLSSFSTLVRWCVWELFHIRETLYGFLRNDERVERNARSIVGTAGTVICADTTGFHKACAVDEGIRKVFVVSFCRTFGGN